jgi:hypothetical protein
MVILGTVYAALALLFVSKDGWAQQTVDTADDFPTYDRVYNIVKIATTAVESSWKLVRNVRRRRIRHKHKGK